MITKADIDASREEILRRMSEGFAAVYRRQDVTDNHVTRLQDGVSVLKDAIGAIKVEGAQQKERLNNLSRSFYSRRATDGRASDVEEPKGKFISQRDATICFATVAATVAFLKFLAWIAPAATVIKP